MHSTTYRLVNTFAIGRFSTTPAFLVTLPVKPCCGTYDTDKFSDSCASPTGERKTFVPGAVKGHAFKGTYGSDSGELKTDVCCSNPFWYEG